MKGAEASGAPCAHLWRRMKPRGVDISIYGITFREKRTRGRGWVVARRCVSNLGTTGLANADTLENLDPLPRADTSRRSSRDRSKSCERGGSGSRVRHRRLSVDSSQNKHSAAAPVKSQG